LTREKIGGALPELVWKGKYQDGPPERPRAVLRTDEVHGARRASWHDRLIHGDTLDVLPVLLDGARGLGGQVGLIYVDPPFDTGGAFDYRMAVPGVADDTPRLEMRAYGDARGLDAWLTWFHATALLLRDLLAHGGSLYVHLDAHAAHYAKIVLDEVMGPGAFQREIVWRIGWVSGFKSRARGWIRNHDTLLFYAKGGRPRTFNKQ
jgi:adenine-specific DNA-methyltransferase